MSNPVEPRLPGTPAQQSSSSLLAGKPAAKEMLVDVARLERDYFERRPDLQDANQLVSFGTSGHRGSPCKARSRKPAICDYRRSRGIDGPLYTGKDTHALSSPAQRTALEVLAATNVETVIQQNDGVTPTPVTSRAILAYNRGRKEHFADGIVIAPSAQSARGWRLQVQPAERRPCGHRPNPLGRNEGQRIAASGNVDVKRLTFNKAVAASTTQVAFANEPDSDRRGIGTPVAGLMNPNHYLAVAIRYLLTHRPQWRHEAAVGKTLVSRSMIDNVVGKLGRDLREVPVGFKWFVPRLFGGSCCFGGEGSAGASFLRHDGTVWTTDKDGLIPDLPVAEITARTGKDPGEHYRELTAAFGFSYYTRTDAPASPEQKSKVQKLSPDAVEESDLAGEPITAKLTRAPGNDAPIEGPKVVAKTGWFAARPSGTEDIYKIYAESFQSEQHLNSIVTEAQNIVNNALRSSAAGRS